MPKQTKTEDSCHGFFSLRTPVLIYSPLILIVLMAMVERRDGEGIGVGSNVALETMHLMPYFSGQSISMSHVT